MTRIPLGLLVLGIAALSSCHAETPAPAAAPTVVMAPAPAAPLPAASASPPKSPPAPSTPLRLASFDSGHCDLVATPTHVYWLEIRDRHTTPRNTPSGSGAYGAALMCDEAGGVLLRASRHEGKTVTLATLDYRPYGLTAQGETLYWTGAPCTGGARSGANPDWFWSYRDGTSSKPTTLGEKDRSYLGVITSPTSVFVSDRFGKGGALRVDEAHPAGESILPDKEQPWLIAADARTLAWADRSWEITLTDLATRKTTRGIPLGEMPSDGSAFAGGWLVRTTKDIVVVSADGRKERTRFPIRDFGGRGEGAFAGGRYYYWADGDDTLSRIDVTTGKVVRVRAPEAQRACGVAVEGDTIFWADSGKEAIFAWRTSIFDETPPENPGDAPAKEKTGG
ncbi:hypothetical protein [Polyangium fumosum]|uniref:DUF5050 domain-containing protein n=1 Tax=Polyangium fumosum TaxID=889272 RepID=A0A4U1JG91_9BACT|nr:hypothetical protein [Polyangium fumosum]TKD09221.1 hypothetical protein E8A74_13170 [Polyangium fumosum]